MSPTPTEPSRPSRHQQLRIVLETIAHMDPGLPAKDLVPRVLEADEAVNKRLMAAVPPTASDPQSTWNEWIDTQTDIVDFMRRSVKINAIKEVRARTKVGLKEAKEAVEAWEVYDRRRPTT